MTDINKVIVIGRLTRDVELKTLNTGTSTAKMSIAVGENIKRGNEWTQETYFFDVIVWAKQAENCAQYLAKGSQVAIEGKLKQNRWEDKTTGEKKNRIEIVAESVQFISKSQTLTTERAATNVFGGQKVVKEYDPWEGM